MSGFADEMSLPAESFETEEEQVDVRMSVDVAARLLPSSRADPHMRGGGR